MRFEAFNAEIYPGPDVCKPEVATLVTFQHGVENRKWCDFHHYTMLLEMCVRQLVQGSTVFIAADQPETSRHQSNTETRNVRPPEFKMADFNPEVEMTLERKELAKRFQRKPPHLRPCPTQI